MMPSPRTSIRPRTESGAAGGRRAITRVWSDDISGAAEDLRRAVRIARGGGVFLPYAVALCYLAEAEYRLGRWDDSLLHAELVASLHDEAVYDREPGVRLQRRPDVV